MTGLAKVVSKQVGSVLAILGGVFYIIGAFVGWIAAAGFYFGLFGAFTSTTMSNGVPPFGGNPAPSFNFGALGLVLLLIIAFGIFTGAMIVVGGALMNSDSAGRRKSGGILTVSMMVLGALPTLGGFGLGFILTLVGAVLGLTYKETSPDLVVGYQQVARPNPQSPAATGSGGMRFCVKCGMALPEGAVYCGSCGAPVPQG